MKRPILARVAIGILLGAVLGIVLYESDRFRSLPSYFKGQLTTVIQQQTICPPGNLYAGIAGTLSNVRKFDGSDWSESGLISGTVAKMLSIGDGAFFAVAGSSIYRCRPNAWEDVTGSQDLTAITALGGIGSDAVIGKASGQVYRFNTDASWTSLGSPHPSAAPVESFTEYQGQLIAAAANQVFRYDGVSWSPISGQFSGVSGIPVMHVHGDMRLYIGTGRNAGPGSGHVYRYLSGLSWEDLGRLGDADTVNRLLRGSNGELYAGTASVSGGEVFTFENNQWIGLGNLGSGIHAIAIYRGELYAGTSKAAGTNVYHFVGSGWVDVARLGNGVLSLEATPETASSPVSPLLRLASSGESASPFSLSAASSQSSAPASSLAAGGFCCNVQTRQCVPAP